MEVQVKELIDRIKSEGIKKAEDKAREIEEQARQKARDIISEARKEAEEIINNAQSEAEKIDITGKQALSQAGRDLILTVRSELISIFDTLVGKEVKDTLSKDLLKKIIPVFINSWVEQKGTDLTLLLSEEDRGDLENYFKKALGNTLKKGVTIKGAPGIESGFKILEKEGSAFYDITDKGITEALCAFLNPRLTAIINETSGSGSK